MGKQHIVNKPLSNKEFAILSGKHPLSDLFLATGARIAEINRIINQWNGEADYIDIKTKKSGNKLNRIWLTEAAIKAIIDYRALGIKGKSNKTIERLIDKIFLQYGFNKEGEKKVFTSHNLRATFATKLSTMGINIKTISVLMNHSDISQTAKYISYDERTMRTALEQMNRFRTHEGMTFSELQSKLIEQRVQLMRAEEEYELLHFQFKELQKENDRLKKGVSNE